MATDTNIRLPADLLAQVAAAAEAEGRTPDDITAEAVKRHLAHRFLAQIRREAAQRRGGMDDEQVEERVGRAIQEHRAENRGR